jgi:hypothetical protein
VKTIEWISQITAIHSKDTMNSLQTFAPLSIIRDLLFNLAVPAFSTGSDTTAPDVAAASSSEELLLAETILLTLFDAEESALSETEGSAALEELLDDRDGNFAGFWTSFPVALASASLARCVPLMGFEI